MTICIAQDTILVMKYELRSTKDFSKWFAKLKDSMVKRKVLACLARVENGNFGDCKQIEVNLFDSRFFFGSGLRIYYTIQGNKVVLLVTGGDKSSQSKDIEKTKNILKNLED